MSKKSTFFFAVFITIVLVIGAGILSVKQTKTYLTQRLTIQQGKEQIGVMRSVAKSLESEISNLFANLTVLAQMPEFQEDSKEICNKRLQTLINTDNDIGKITINGTYTCAANPLLVGGNAISTTSARLLFLPKPQRQILSTLSASPLSSEYNFKLFLPIYNDKSVLAGLLTSTLPAKKIISQYIGSIATSQNGYAAVFDNNGDILYHTRHDLIGKNIWDARVQKALAVDNAFLSIVKSGIAGYEGTKRYRQGKIERVGTYTFSEVLPGRNWAILYSTPVQDIQNSYLITDINNFLVRLIITVLALTVAFLFFFLFYSVKTIFSPIEKLTRAIQKVSEGDLSTRVPLSGNDEIGKLALSFNEMINKLQWSQKNLEQRATQKTQEVEKKIEELVKMNTFMVGRELEMAELKKQITELKRKMDKDLTAGMVTTSGKK